jgi:hypothetical protein
MVKAQERSDSYMSFITILIIVIHDICVPFLYFLKEVYSRIDSDAVFKSKAPIGVFKVLPAAYTFVIAA